MSTSGFDPKTFHDDLAAHGHIIPGGVQGVFGRGRVFEDVVERFNHLVTAVAMGDGAESVAFPPVIERKILERVDYMDSFPQLAGSIHSFFGNDREARALSDVVHSGEPWGHLLRETAVVLTPAACYPVYQTLAGTLPEKGRLVSLTGWVFRHEPSPEPTRMQAFRMREFVRAGRPDDVVAWRDEWLQRGLTLLEELGLPVRSALGSDPFFGRAGKMLRDGQKAQRLKLEILVPVISEQDPTAVCSFNYHQDKFGQVFGIRTAGGVVAHTACVGFGLERVVMALLKTHGLAPETWPKAARDRLWT
ncbi:MAG TPA: amino acid--[acyl-carrier-protein] ligase [Methylomirabilota bacterium]